MRLKSAVFGCVMEAEKENVLWSWIAENKRRGEKRGIEARGRWRSRIAWGDGADEQAVNEQSCLLPSSSQKMALGKRNSSLGGLNLLPSPGL